MKVVQASVNQLVPGMLLSMGVGLLCKKFNYFSLKNLALTRLDLVVECNILFLSM